MPLRRLDPRLNPMVRPHEWIESSRRTRRRLLGLVGASVVALLGLVAYLLYPVDQTRDMTPEAVVKAAGKAILDVDRYRFSVQLSGQSVDNQFPSAAMSGTYQRSPLLMQLDGWAQSGESKVPLKYYLDGADVYLQDPLNKSWMLLRQANLDELYSFQPDNLAAPLLHGLRSATVLGREELTEGETLVLKLDLDTEIMKSRLQGGQGDTIEYQLWVYTHSLRPARFAIDVRSGRPDASANNLAYVLNWEFKGVGTVQVPDEVKGTAKELSEPQAPLGLPKGAPVPGP